jgi:hypothetical protein
MFQWSIKKVIVTAAIIIFLGTAVYFAAMSKHEPSPLGNPHVTSNIPDSFPASTSTPVNPNDGPQRYINSALGFELTFPDKSWVLPNATDTDPHFSSSQDCADGTYAYGADCRDLEIQDTSDEISSGPDTMFNNANAEGREPEKLTSLIPGAVVIKANFPGPDGWVYEYSVFFKAAHKAFWIFTDATSLEQDILPTFKMDS